MGNLYFGGQQIKRPGAYSKVDTLNMIPVTLGAFNVLCFIGPLGTFVSEEGVTAMPDNAVAWFNQPSYARKAIGDCDLMDCLDIAWRHGADLVAVSPVKPTGDISTFAATHEYAANVYVKPVTSNTHFYKVTTAGTSASTEPTWPTTSGGTVTSGTVVFTEVGTIPASGKVATDADWQTAIDRLEVEDIDCLVPITTHASIHAKIMTHVGAMSTIKARMERRAVYGHEPGLTATEVVALQTAYADERALLATPCVYSYDSSGNKVLRPSYFTAAAYAGIWSSQEPQEPITYKYLKGFAGLEKRYTSVEIGQLLDGHIAPVEYVKNKGYRIVQGLTTSSSADISQNEWSVSVLKDVMSKNLRNHFEDKFVGKAGVRGIEVTIYNDLITMLEKFIKNGWITEYAKDSVSVVKDGVSFYLDYEAKPTLPINYILITSHFTL